MGKGEKRSFWGGLWSTFIIILLAFGLVCMIISPYMLLISNHKNQKLVDEGMLQKQTVEITDKYTLEDSDNKTDYCLRFNGGKVEVSRKKYNASNIGDSITVYTLDGKNYKDSADGFFASKLLIVASFIMSFGALYGVIKCFFPSVWDKLSGFFKRNK